LLHAIGHEFHRLHPRAKIIYMSAEKFTVEFLAALRANETFKFKQQLRSADLLMIDDVQFIAGKESTQEEFFHTMNEIISAGRRFVISSDRAPQDSTGSSRASSRASPGGLVADINAADLELRLNIITKKLERCPTSRCRRRGDVPRQEISSNVRELEGALNRIAAYATMQNRVIDLDFVGEVLANILRANQRRISIDEIQTASPTITGSARPR
jgi:chromosomal replication initiator protein